MSEVENVPVVPEVTEAPAETETTPEVVEVEVGTETEDATAE